MKSANFQRFSGRDFVSPSGLSTIVEESGSDTDISSLSNDQERGFKRSRQHLLEHPVLSGFRSIFKFVDGIVNPAVSTTQTLDQEPYHLYDDVLPCSDDGVLWSFISDQLLCDYQVGHGVAYKDDLPYEVEQFYQASIIGGDFSSYMLWSVKNSGDILSMQSLSDYTCAPRCCEHSFGNAKSGYWRPAHFGPLTRTWVDSLVSSIVNAETLQSSSVPQVMRPFTDAILSIFSLGTTSVDPIQSDVDQGVEQLRKQGFSPLEAFRYAVAHWEKFLDSPIATHVTNLVGCAIVAGFLPSDYGELHINSIRVYQVSNLSRLHSFTDFSRAIVGSLNYFVEAVVASWEAGSLEPFLMERTNSRVLDEAYEEVNQIMVGIPTGEYYRQGGEWSLAMYKLDQTLGMYQQAVKSISAQTWLRNIFSTRILNLQRWRFELSISKKGGSLRSQPYCAMFYGASRCGKSAISQMTMKYHAALQGIKWDPSLVANITADEKHHNSIHNGTKFFFYDDVCNRPLAYDPSYGIAGVLQSVNNVQFVANKAELELKGMVMPDPIGVYGTTNVADFMATKISLEPESIYLRIVRISVFVRPEYIQEGTTGAYDRLKFETNPRYCFFGKKKLDDAHYLMIERWDNTSGYIPMEADDGRTLSHLNLAEYLHYMGINLKKHHQRQDEYLANQDAVTFSEEDVSRDNPPLSSNAIDTMRENGVFPSSTFDNQGPSFDKTKAAVKMGFKKALQLKFGDFPFILTVLTYLSGIDFLVAQTTAIIIDHFASHDAAQWWYWIPDSWWNEKLFKRLAPVLQDTQIRKEIVSIKTWRYRYLVLFPLCVYFEYYPAACAMVLLFLNTYRRGAFLRISAYRNIVTKRRAVQEVAQAHREKLSPYVKFLQEWIPWLGVGISAVAGIHWLFGPSNTITFGPDTPPPKDWRSTDQQGFMGMTEQDMREKEKVRNQWQQQVVNAVSGIRNPNMTGEQLIRRVAKNTSRFLAWENGEWRECCHITWLCSDICTIPAHMMPTSTMKWRIYDSDNPCARKDVVVSPSSFRPSGYGDIALGHIKYRSKRSIIQYLDYLPAELRAARLHLEPGTCDMRTYGVTGGRVTSFEGHDVIEWRSPHESETGDCGAAYIRLGSNPSIVGFHFAAQTGNHKVQRSALFAKHELEDFIRCVMDGASTLISSNAPETWNVNGPNGFTVRETKLPENDMAQQVDWLMENTDAGAELQQRNNSVPIAPEVKPPTFEPPSMVKEFTKQAIPIGTAGRSAYYKSNCVDTLMAEAVRERLGIHHGKPKFGRSMYPKSAMYTFNGSCNLPPSMLEWAAQDYLSAFRDLPRHLLDDLKPLSDDEVLNGKDGVRFIDSMNFSTSMGEGFPGGKKAWVMEYLDTLTGHVRKQFMQEVWDEVKLALNRLSKGERVPFIFRATPKDEPTPVTKEKVRIFMVGQITCIMLVRKYFTPVCRLIQMTTGISECAVGINATSPDWEQVQQYLDRFSRIFDGDHSKYDLVKNAATSTASYKIMIELAAMGHYTANDLFIMTMLVNDLVYPLTSYAGMLYHLDGSTPSGIPVTVIVNSLDNSLMNRCAFLASYPSSRIGDFRRYVAHVNYGDDFINSVSLWRRRFNFLSMQKFLASYGLKITPGVKDAEGKAFMDRKKVVFLKRHSVKLPELRHRVGALEMASIYKSLETVIKTKAMSPEQALAVNIDGALRELVYHGRETFTKEQAWLHEQATQHGIAHLCTLLQADHGELLRSLQNL